MYIKDKKQIKQLKFWQIILLFAWPSAWYTFLIYGAARLWIPEGGITPTWIMMAVIVLGPGAELAAGLWFLKREGYKLFDKAFWERINFSWPKGKKAWIIAVIALILGIALSMAMGPANKALASLPGFVPPDWWAHASNPLVEINSAHDVFPDIQLEGNFLFFVSNLLIGLIFNIFGEELYYRGFLLPRMRRVFGKWDWVVNGILFTLKHVYQRWLYPGILVGGLAFAFAAGPLGSLPLAMLYHWVGNFLFNTIFLLMAVLRIG